MGLSGERGVGVSEQTFTFIKEDVDLILYGLRLIYGQEVSEAYRIELHLNWPDSGGGRTNEFVKNARKRANHAKYLIEQIEMAKEKTPDGDIATEYQRLINECNAVLRIRTPKHGDY
jgi:hypothetical protein